MRDSSACPTKKPRRHRSLAEILTIIGDYRASGLTQAAYAGSRGLALSTLTNWLRRMRTDNSSSFQGQGQGQGFVEAQVVDFETAQSRVNVEDNSYDFELMLSHRHQDDRRAMVESVRLRSGFDSGDLNRVLEVLEIENQRQSRA